MNITIDKKQNCEAELHIELDAQTVQERRKGIVQRYQKLARVPGFRPGKTPLAVVEKRFSKEIDGELREALVGDGCREAASEHKLAVIKVRDVRNDTFQPDGNFSFTADLTLEPEIVLPEYKGIKVTAPAAEVSDALFETRLTELRRQFAAYADITDRPLKDGDIAIIDYSGTVLGTPIEEAEPEAPLAIRGTTGYWVRIEEGGFLPGFVPQIQGMSIGDSKENVVVTLPEDHPLTSLAGAELVYKVEIKGIKESTLPEVDDAFAERLLPGKTAAELLDLFRQRILDEVIQKRREKIVEQIVTHLDNSTSAELPADIVNSETQRRVDQMVENGLRQGLDNDDIEAKQEEIFASAAEQARHSVKTTFLLEQIARAENLSVSDQELIVRIDGLARRSNKTLKKLIGELKRENLIENLRAQMLVGKAIDFLVLHADVTEGEIADAPASLAEA